MWFHANGRNIVALRFACHRTIEMLGLVAPKFDRFQTIRNKCQQMPTLLWYHAKGRNMIGPKMLRVVGQQCCIRFHGPFRRTDCSKFLGITMFSVPGKILNRIILQKLIGITDEILSKRRENELKKEQIVTLKTIIEQSIEWMEFVLVCYIHRFEKALDNFCVVKLF